MKMGPNRILTQTHGTTSFLPPASRVKGQERHHSCHPLPESKEGQGRHQSTFRFCSGITQLSPALFQLGQEPLNHKHLHTQHTPVLAGPLHPAAQGAPSTSSPTAHWEHLALALHLCGLLAPFLSARCLLGCRDHSVLDLGERKMHKRSSLRRGRLTTVLSVVCIYIYIYSFSWHSF